ncbi:hypothetical protein TNCV_1055201 [Trichonephila clavipes]|nr:hypothetical protein TNCV_1055201 [Trichonephila clavipes]
MAAVDFLHHENPPTWTVIEPATLSAEDQRQTNLATQSADITNYYDDGPRNFELARHLSWHLHLTSTPHQREDVSALDRFNVNPLPYTAGL